MSQVLPSVFQVVVTTRSSTNIGTAFQIGNNEFLTAAHVIKGAGTIRPQNHERTLRQVEVVGVDTPSDVAVLRADGTRVPPCVSATSRPPGSAPASLLWATRCHPCRSRGLDSRRTGGRRNTVSTEHL